MRRSAVGLVRLTVALKCYPKQREDSNTLLMLFCYFIEWEQLVTFKKRGKFNAGGLRLHWERFWGVPGGWGRWLEASRYRVVTVGTGGTGF